MPAIIDQLQALQNVTLPEVGEVLVRVADIDDAPAYAGAAVASSEALADVQDTLSNHANDNDAHDLAALRGDVIGRATQDDLDEHVTDTANPHATTAAQVGAYTTGQVDTLLTGKANSSHTHTLSQVTDAGTAAALAWGNGSGQLARLVATGGLTLTGALAAPQVAIGTGGLSVNGTATYSFGTASCILLGTTTSFVTGPGRFHVAGADAEVSIQDRTKTAFTTNPSTGDRFSALVSAGTYYLWSGGNKWQVDYNSNTTQAGRMTAGSGQFNGAMTATGNLVGSGSLTLGGTSSLVASSSTQVRTQGYTAGGWIVSTDASRRAYVDQYVSDFNGDRRTIRHVTDGTTGWPLFTCNATLPDDADIPNGMCAFADDGNNFSVKIKSAGGTVTTRVFAEQ